MRRCRRRCPGRPAPRRRRPLAKAPPESADLSAFKGYDAVVVTWTAAEASSMATLFTPGYPLAEWYEYRHNVANYAPLVTGAKAPFNDRGADMARYYHSLGLYFPCTIRGRAFSCSNPGCISTMTARNARSAGS
jgi:hypothetical protein